MGTAFSVGPVLILWQLGRQVVPFATKTIHCENTFKENAFKDDASENTFKENALKDDASRRRGGVCSGEKESFLQLAWQARCTGLG